MFDAIKTGKGFKGTFEAFPERGKYSHDGHYKCKVCMTPEETIIQKGICRVCGRKVTVGAMHRVELLSDRKQPVQQPGAADFDYIVTLTER